MVGWNMIGEENMLDANMSDSDMDDIQDFTSLAGTEATDARPSIPSQVPLSQNDAVDSQDVAADQEDLRLNTAVETVEQESELDPDGVMDSIEQQEELDPKIMDSIEQESDLEQARDAIEIIMSPGMQGDDTGVIGVTQDSIQDVAQSLTSLDPGGTSQEGCEMRHDQVSQEVIPRLEGTTTESNNEDHDPESLFISEHATPPASNDIPIPITSNQPISARVHAPSQMLPPPRPSARPAASNLSKFDRIRNMQKKVQDRKNAASKRAAVSQGNFRLENETYLEAVQSQNPEAEEEKAHNKALTEFNKKKEHYDGLRNDNGDLRFKEDIEWRKIQAAETARLNKRRREMAWIQGMDEGPIDLFPDLMSATPSSRMSDTSYEMDEHEPGPSRKRRLDGAGPEPSSMQDFERRAMEVSLEAQNDLPQKKQKSDKSAKDSPRSTGSNNNARAKTMPKNAKSNSSKGSTRSSRKAVAERKAHAYKQASSLFTSNVFEQQAKGGDADQPVFKGRNKQTALKELIASIPLEDQKQKRNDMNTILRATKDFDGIGSVRLVEGGWRVRGMKTSLRNYQVLGSAFMRRRENGTEEPRGGLMADQMGLGKTLMMLANIVNGRLPRGVHPRTTLLVASPALVGQWEKEIATHTDCGLEIMRYTAGSRAKTNDDVKFLGQFDVLLTTWGEVMKSYPKNEPPIWCQSAEQKIIWWKDTYEKQRGPLHRVLFHRIVLDEAQAIKNHQSRTSVACRALMATHKWALSGTPIMNSLTELYPYFKFLGVPYTGSFRIFKHNYCDAKSGEITERLATRLSSFMIRRMHGDRLFDAPILKLPQAAQTTFWCEFNSVERCVYDVVHKRFTQRINTWAKQGELQKSYSNAMVMLLRLRQLAAHILMLQIVMRDLLEREDIEKIRDIVNEQAATSTSEADSTIIAIRKQLEKHAVDGKKQAKADEKIKASAKAAGKTVEEYKATKEYKNSLAKVQGPQLHEEPNHDEEDGSPRPSAKEGAGDGGSGRTFGKTYNFLPYLKSLREGESWENAKKRAECSWCGKQPRNPWITSCGHLICVNPCLEESDMRAAEQEMSHSPCKACGEIPYSVQACDIEEDFFDAVSQGTRSKGAGRAKSRKLRQEQEEIPSDWLSSISDEVLPSAKMIAMKSQILNWRKENPHVKVIVYTQFLAMVKIMARICQSEGWRTEQYIGTMSFSARDKAITRFANDPKCNILLASLRCGGLGLNLTMASRVILVDPWWNSASEQQAFCRVFRIGQKDETFMSRLVVRNTVDQRLMQMQERKQKEISEVMEKTDRVKQMSPRDLMRLFGNLDEDEEGRPFILVDDLDRSGGFRADQDHEGYADDA